MFWMDGYRPNWSESGPRPVQDDREWSNRHARWKAARKAAKAQRQHLIKIKGKDAVQAMLKYNRKPK